MNFKHLLKTTALTAMLLLAGKVGWGQVSLTTFGSAYTQDFNTLAITGTTNAWTDNSTIAGWYSNRTVYIADDGTSNSGGLRSYGTTSQTERAIGGVGSSSAAVVYYGCKFVNNTGSIITSLLVSFDGEQWRNGGNTSTQPLTFSYQVGATTITGGTWTNVSQLLFTSPIATATAAALDGNNASNRVAGISYTITGLNIANGQEIWIRWEDINDAGNDHGLAIDNLSVTAVADTQAPTWTATYPKTANVAKTSFDLVYNMNEAGTAYYVVLANNATAPTAADVKAGTGATIKGSKAITSATTDITSTVSGLTAGTDYDVYVVAEDGTPNLQADPVKIDVTTVALSTDATITTSASYTIDNGAETITNVPASETLAVFEGNLTPAAGAGFETYEANGTTVATDLQTGYKVIVTAEAGNKKTYTITKLVSLSAEKDILTYSLADQTGTATINSTNHTVAVEVAYGINRNGLIATFTLSPKASAKVGTTDQVSGTTPNDFSSDVTYIVKAEDASIQNWVVTVTNKAASTDATISSGSYTVDNGTETITNIPYNETLANFESKLTPAANATFETYQANGTTVATDLATGYKVIVTAQDGSTKKTYTITLNAAPAAELFISEYIEGTSSNKAIEIYNGTGGNVDLSHYSIKLFPNGGTTATPNEVLSGILADGETFVIGNSSANAAIKAVTDIFSTATFFNGDDAFGLYKDDVLIDVFGTIGSDPGTGWAIAGSANSTVDKTLVRKDAITFGTTVWATSAGTDATNSQWIINPTDNTTFIGWHKVKSNAKELLTFDLSSKTGPAVINNTAYTVAIEVANGTNVTTLSPTITVSKRATISPASGASTNFTAPVEYTVTAQDGTTQKYTVTVTIAPSADATLSAFTISGQSIFALPNLNVADIADAGATYWMNSVSTATGFGITTNEPNATVEVKVNGSVIAPANYATQTFANNDVILVTVTAQNGIAKKYYKVTLKQKPVVTVTSGANGSITPSGTVAVDYGTDKSFDVTPNAGYHIATLAADGASVDAALNLTSYTHTFTNVTADHTLGATFALTKYTVTFNVTTGGNPLEGATLSLTGYADQTTDASGVATFTDVVPGTIAYSVSKDTYTTVNSSVNVDGNKTVPITLNLAGIPKYTVTFTVKEGATNLGGATVTLTGYGNATTDVNGVATFIDVVAATINYSVEKTGYVTANGSVTVVDANVDEAVSLTKQKFNITATANTNGTISPSGSVEVIYGENKSFDVTADANYKIASIAVDGSNISIAANATSHTYTFNNVSANHTIAATFALKSYAIAANVLPGGAGNISGAGNYNHGASVTLTATANSGYSFVEWRKGSEQVSTNATYTFTATEDLTLDAVFEVNASSLVYEGFNYAVGAALQTQTGWTLSNTGDDLLIEEGSLTYPGLKPSTANKVTFAGAGIDAYKEFTNITTGTVYYSFILKVTDVSSATEVAGGYFTGLGADNTNFGSAVWTKKNGEDFNIGISNRSNTTPQFSTSAYPINKEMLIVVCYEIVNGTANDISKIWFNPSPATFGSGSAPAADITITNTTGSDLSSVKTFFLRQDSNTETPNIEYDEARIGTTWAEVTPAISSNPYTSVSVSSLADFGNIVYNTVGAAEQSFVVGGYKLTNDITISAPAGFEISQTSGASFAPSSSITLTQTSGVVYPTTVYVRFHPTLVQAYSDNIAITSNGTSNKQIAVTGTGIASDIIAPSFLTGYPNFANVGPYTLDVKVKIDEAGFVYLHKVIKDATAPTAEEIKAQGMLIDAVAANTEYTASVTGLTDNTEYDFYFVAVDKQATPNVSSIEKKQVTTATIPIFTIADIQTPANGTEDSQKLNEYVTTTGIVSALKNGTSGQEGFFIQDKAQEWSGILVYSPEVVSIGQSVTVTGKVAEVYAKTEISPVTKLVKGSLGNTPYAPITVTTQNANDEKYEGVLVKVTNAICQSGSAGTFVVSDGSGNLTVYKGIFVDLALVATKKYDIIGVIDDYKPTSGNKIYELYPRGAFDITEITTSIDDNFNSNLAVYPNPFTDEIRFSGAENVKRIVITSITGQVVKNEVVDVNDRISTSELNKGMYFVTFINDKGEKATKKMIKQ